jgi:pimeloyl-ACP methyl ester carboxylesterase
VRPPGGVPTLPLGARRRPMRADADMSLRVLALLVGEFLERLDLREVTLVLNDWGAAQFLISEGRADRLARLVLTSCEGAGPGPAGLLQVSGRAGPGLRPVRNCLIPYPGIFFAHMVENLPG